MTPAEIAAAPWWRWHDRLTAVVGSVTYLWRDVTYLWRDTGQIGAVATPDLADPLLPGWLLHLLRERTGPGTHAHPDVVAGGGWDVWVDRAEPGSPAVWRCIGSGDTEIDALLAALQGVGS